MGEPKCGAASVMLRRFVSRPFTSVGTVAISYRSPKFAVKFGGQMSIVLEVGADYGLTNVDMGRLFE